MLLQQILKRSRMDLDVPGEWIFLQPEQPQRDHSRHGENGERSELRVAPLRKRNRYGAS